MAIRTIKYNNLKKKELIELLESKDEMLAEYIADYHKLKSKIKRLGGKK